MASFTEALAARIIADPAVEAMGASVWWRDVPQGTVGRYIRLSVVSDVRSDPLKGRPPRGRARVQVDAFAGTYEDARALAEAAIGAVLAPAVLDGVRFGGALRSGVRDSSDFTGGYGDTKGGWFQHMSQAEAQFSYAEG